MGRWAERGAVSLVGLIAAPLALASCGGRASSLQASGSGSDSGSAGSSQGVAAVGGSASGGGAATRSKGGAAGNGATSGAGTLPGSDAGPPVCIDNCPEIACPAGQTLQYPDPTLCCPVCVACNASDRATCQPSYDCGPAAHAEVLPGQCCLSCVANDPDACMTQVSGANDHALSIVRQYSQQCQVDSDCAVAVLSTTCSQTCILAPQTSLSALLAELTMVEACPACPAPNPITPVCDTPACLNQTCQVPNFK